MYKGWVYENELIHFTEILAHFADYTLDSGDVDAIRYGVVQTDQEANHWFEYSLQGSHAVQFRLAKDPGTAVIHFEITASGEIEEKMKVAMVVMDIVRR